ncbi:MAG: hypothetical protein ACR2IG_04635 [Roseomonas sp.]
MKRNSLLGSVAILSLSLMVSGPAMAGADLYQAYAEALGLEDAGAPSLRLGATAIAANELADMRGGFSLPGGVTVAFGFDIETRLGGVTTERLNMPSTTLGSGNSAPVITVTDTNGAQRQVTMAGGPVMIEALGANGATRLQTIIGNGITSVVQNAADGQQVQRFATVTVDVAGMRNMLAQFGQNRVMENAMSFRRAIPR